MTDKFEKLDVDTSNVGQTFETYLRAGIGSIPVLGTALLECTFEHRSRVKQNRLNRFIIILSEFLKEQIDRDFDIDEVEKEDLGDVFESVLKKVVESKSEKKLIRFRNILLGFISKNNSDIDLIQAYINITSTLSDAQIIILESFAKNKEGIKKQKKLIQKIEGELNQNKVNQSEYRKGVDDGSIKPEGKLGMFQIEEAKIQSELKLAKDKLKYMEQYKYSEYYGLDRGEFNYYLRDLISKGLLNEIFITQTGSTSLEHTKKEISDFGLQFVSFIKLND